MGKASAKTSSASPLKPPSAEEITKQRRFELVVPFISDDNATDSQIENILKLTPPSEPENPLLGLQTSDPIPDQLAKLLFLTLTTDVLNFSWAIVPPFTSWPKHYLRTKFAPLLKQVGMKHTQKLK